MPVAVAMLDIDHFKRINDRHGHDCGDLVLKAVAGVLNAAGGEHLVARLGGEEFAMLFGALTGEEVCHCLETLRQTIAELKIDYADQPIQVSISIGLARSDEASLDELIRQADGKLYQAKEAGRNRLVF